MLITETNLINAFYKKQDVALKHIHEYLNRMYYEILFGKDMDYSPATIITLKRVENLWIENEKEQILAKYDCYKTVKSQTDVQVELQKHPVFNHEIFNYLQAQGNLKDLQEFLLNDSILNLEFFDYLVLAIIGVSDTAKAEIASNIWDEAGKGNVSKFHTTLFKKLMTEMGLVYNRSQIIKSMSWQGIAGINLFSYCALYSSNQMKYFGLLAATEMLDPPHYHQLNKAILRVSPITVDQSYYIEHESIDVDHAYGWMQRVILPELHQKPEETVNFWLGFYLRLDSAHAYYSRLLSYLQTAKAA